MNKLFTILIIFFPILSIYVTFIPNLSIADLLLSSVLIPISIIYFDKKIVIKKSIIPIYLFFIYIFITLIFQILNSTGVGFFSTIRYLIYLFTIPLCYYFFDFRFGMRLLNKVSNWVSFYVIIQFISFFFFSHILPWKIPGLPLVDPKFAEAGDGFFSMFYRPTGIFLEPTHFAQYAMVSVCYYLVSNIYQSGKIYKTFLPTLGILVSASSLGFIALLILYSFWIWKKLIVRFDFKKLVLIFSFCCIIIFLLGQVDYFRFIIERVVGGEGESFGAAFGYRFNSIEYFFNTNFGFQDFLIGRGRSSEDVYFTGLFYFLNANGILGVLFYFALMISLINNSRSMGSLLLVLVFLISVGSELVANFGVLFYLAFAITEKRNSFNSLEYVK